MSLLFSTAVWSADISDPTSKFILLRLADHANDAGECWPSVASICKSTGLCERSVQGKLRALEKSGIIKITRGVNRSTYFLSMEALKSTPQDLHPAESAPRRICHPTPQDLRPTPQTVLPYPANLAAPYKEPSRNRQRTVKEPSGVKARGTIEELKKFAIEIGLPESDGESMFYHWESNGWKNGSSPSKNWKAGIQKWKSQGWLPSQKKPINGKPKNTSAAQYGI